MKRHLLTGIFIAVFFSILTVSAAAVTNNMVKVGLRYGSRALSSANLENAVGSGYTFGYYDSSRNFVTLGSTSQKKITTTPSTGYRIQTSRKYSTFSSAAAAAAAYKGGYPAYIAGSYFVRVGKYSSSAAAKSAQQSLGIAGSVLSAGSTGVLVKTTDAGTPLYEYDSQGLHNLAILPNGQGTDAVTWFKGYKYHGGFEYARVTGGNLNVINVVNLEDYVKGVIPYEMSASWPTEALKAQAVCARTYACNTTKHLKTYGFDVCNTTDCQVYRGTNRANANSDAAVDATVGQCLYYKGKLIEAVYFSSDGGATEDAKNVWGGSAAYLIGKKDPYESTISIPNYNYTVTYTASQLTWVLQHSGYSIGTVCNVYVSQYTAVGNVYEVTFVDTSGKKLVVRGSKCRSVFYSKTYKKSVPSLHFKIYGGSAEDSGDYYVNDSSTKLSSLDGVSTISGSGVIRKFSGGTPYGITSSGTESLSGEGSGSTASTSGTFTITGSGNGHSVGMSQYGANAMAKQGYTYKEILNFYYTNVTLK